MKWLVILLFAIASATALLWFESTERNYTAAQKTTLLVSSLPAWAFVLAIFAITT